MALDRQSIARRDFPSSGQGYDRAAVDAHLAALADEVGELLRAAPGGSGAGAHAGEQVRAIVDAAEQSAVAIREGANAQAREHVARVAEAADHLRSRVDALDRELTGLMTTLRAGADRLARDLEEAAAAASALGGGASRTRAAARGALGVTLAEVPAAVDEEVGEEPALAAVDADEVGTGSALGAVDAAEGAGGQPAARNADVVGARLVALEMATSGRPREETDRFLAEHYDLPDRAAMLDEVYARVRT